MNVDSLIQSHLSFLDLFLDFFLDFVDVLDVVGASFVDPEGSLLQDILCLLQSVSIVSSSISNLHLSLVDQRHLRMGLRGMATKTLRLLEDPWAVGALELTNSVGLDNRLRRHYFLDLLAFDWKSWS